LGIGISQTNRYLDVGGVYRIKLTPATLLDVLFTNEPMLGHNIETSEERTRIFFCFLLLR